MCKPFPDRGVPGGPVASVAGTRGDAVRTCLGNAASGWRATGHATSSWPRPASESRHGDVEVCLGGPELHRGAGAGIHTSRTAAKGARFGEPLEQREERRHAVSERTSSEARTDQQTQARPLGAGRAEQGSDGLRPRRVTPGGSRPAPRPPSGGKGTRNATDPPTEEPPLGAAPTAVDRYRLRQRRNRPSGWGRQRWTGFFHKGGGWLRPAATRGPRFGVAPIRSRSRSPDGRAASSPLSGGGGSAGRPNVRRTEPRSGRAQCPRALRNAARGAVPRRSVPGDDQRPASKRAGWGNPARAPSSGAEVDARDNGTGSTWTER